MGIIGQLDSMSAGGTDGRVSGQHGGPPDTEGADKRPRRRSVARILRAGGTMRSMQWHGSPTAAIAPRAGLLLLVLLAHVAFMASPLHAAMLDGSGTPHGMAGSDAVPPAQVAQARAGGGHAGHCVLAWTKSSAGLGVVLLMAAAAVGAIGGPLMGLASPSLERPVARALGPPSFGDPQALLQVFRE